MLSQHNAIPTIATSDLAKAREYYEGKLGLVVDKEEEDLGVLYRAGAGEILLYPSAYAGTNRATYVSFDIPADDFDTEIIALRARGIMFDTFDLEGTTWDDGVASTGDFKAVWFHDPEGNVINVMAR